MPTCETDPPPTPKRNSRSRIPAFIAAFAILAALAAIVWRSDSSSNRKALIARPLGIMGTDCELIIVTGKTPADAGASRRAISIHRAQLGLRQAEATLRGIEAKMSAWLDSSEISRLNQASAGNEIRLSPGSLTVLQAARAAHEDTLGAFDATIGPVISLWRAAARENALPPTEDIESLRRQSNWSQIELTSRGARKRNDQARIDLGGIAKGYAIDEALAAIRKLSPAGALVNVGGDLACFGMPPSGEIWNIEIRNPFGGDSLGILRIPDGAVCTSGNYARFQTIAGQRYSHIIDPRTGWPADAVPSVTVWGPSAMPADIWATALSVLGADGIPLLPPGLEALLVIGEASDYRILATPGIAPHLDENLRRQVIISNPDS